MSNQPSSGQQSEHPAWPSTADDAVERLVAMLSGQNKQAIRDAESIFLFHFSLGMWIRNFFGLWGGNQALMNSCARRRRERETEGAADADDHEFADSLALLHSDDASTVILEALQERLRRD